MNDEAADPTATPPGRPTRPLGLPPGSIRALVALTIVGVIVHETLAGREVSLLLSETLLIVLAHYFAARRARSGPVRADASHEPNPLWLPKNSVRLLIVGAFVATGIYLLAAGRWQETAVVANLWIVLAYFAGTAVGAITRSRAPGDHVVTRLWQHLLALGMVIIAALLALSSFAGRLQELPDSLEKFLMAALLFYFGSR